MKVSIIGKIIVISTSKIRKIIVIKKNRIEKGKRGDFSGSNPHSKGEDFSWSSLVFIEIVEASKLKMFAIMIDRKAETIEILIFCSLNKDLLIGS